MVKVCVEAFTADKISSAFLFQGGDEVRGTRLARETKIDNLAGLDTKL